MWHKAKMKNGNSNQTSFQENDCNMYKFDQHLWNKKNEKLHLFHPPLRQIYVHIL